MYQLMIVDDEEKIRTGISDYFPWGELGYKVVYLAENGQQAFDFLLTGTPVDVVLCDIRMPIVDGLELLDMVKESQITGIRFVILSGYQEFEYAQRAMRHGIKDYLLKPTRYKELAKVFSRLKLELDEQTKTETEVFGVPPTSTLISLNTIERIKKMVREQYGTVTLQQAAEAVSLSPSYLSKLFKAKTSQNFYDYLLQIRMEAAMNLIIHTDHKIYEISEMVGYQNQKSFLKVFKRLYSKNPNEYRKDYHG